MRQYEHIPIISPDAGFPVSDIDYEMKQKGDAWIAKLAERDTDDCRRYLVNSAAILITPNTARTAEGRSLAAADELCNKWDQKKKVDGNDLQLARHGLTVSQAFLNETHILPKVEMDLSGWLNEMRSDIHFDHEQFADFAMESMQRSHPRLFDLYTDLTSRARGIYVNLPQFDANFKAGMALPYMLSSMSVMLQESRESRFTSMSNEKIDLKEAELGQLFSTEKRVSAMALIKERLTLFMLNEQTGQGTRQGRLRKMQTKIGATAARLQRTDTAKSISTATARLQQSETVKSVAAHPVSQAFAAYWRAQQRK